MNYTRQPGLGDGQPCSGCGEAIHPNDLLFTVSFPELPLSWLFHDVCFEAWSKFK